MPHTTAMTWLVGDEEEWHQWQQKGDPVLHIDLRKWADLLIVAPLSANTLAKVAQGLCDNCLTSVVRAWDFTKPLLVNTLKCGTTFAFVYACPCQTPTCRPRTSSPSCCILAYAWPSCEHLLASQRVQGTPMALSFMHSSPECSAIAGCPCNEHIHVGQSFHL